MLALYSNRIENNYLLILNFSNKVNPDEESYFIKYQKNLMTTITLLTIKFYAGSETSQCQY